MKYVVNNIEWDTDGESVDLPKELTVNVPDDISSPIQINEYISDEITNTTGFCHFGFKPHLQK